MILQAAGIGTTVKSAFRDYLATNIQASNGSFYTPWGGFDCKLVDEIDGKELPSDRPLISIHTYSRRRKSMGRAAGQARIDFVLEVRVLADSVTGALIQENNTQATDEQLSDDVENLIDSDAGRAALSALGLDAVTMGERRESVREGLHLNITPVSFSVTVQS